MKLVVTLPLLAAAMSATAQAPDAKPARVVAMMAAVGDRIELVTQHPETGSHLEPYAREVLQVPSQALNYAVLRGLNAAMADEQPQTERVLLQWTLPAKLADRIQNALGPERQSLVLDAVMHYLSALPERQNWDQVELVVPTYKLSPLSGMGMRLSGIGIFVQTVTSHNYNGRFDSYGRVPTSYNTDGYYKTVDPNTGKIANSSVYVAPYMYFERLTYNAKTLELIKRQDFYASTKYADPQTITYDVAQQLPVAQLTDKLMEMIEHAAYQSIHPTASEVKVSPIKVLPANSAAGG